jgi:O-antigen ligase
LSTERGGDRRRRGTERMESVLTAARPVLLPLLAATCVTVALLRPRAAVVLWMALAATTVPIPLLRVRSAQVHFASAYLALLLLLWGVRLARRGRWAIAPSRLNLPLLTLAAAAVLASLLGAAFHDPDVTPAYGSLAVRAYATVLVLLSVGAAFLVGNELNGVVALRWMYRIVLGSGLVFVVAPFLPLPLYTGEPSWWPLVLAHGLALTYARVLCDRSWPGWAKGLGAAVVAGGWMRLIVPQLLHPERGGQWLAGWIAVTLPLVVITLVRSRRIVAFGLVPVALLAAFFYLRPVVERARFEGAAYRVGVWVDAGRLALLRPFFGVGPGNYPDYVGVYGVRLDPYAVPQDLVTSAHGDYQQVAAEIGLVGLAALVWVLIEALLLAGHLFRSLESPFLRSFVLGIVGSLGGMAAISVVGDYLIPAYHNGGHTSFCTTVYAWTMIGALMAIESIDAARERAPCGDEVPRR